jgi:hypothetical protein
MAPLRQALTHMLQPKQGPATFTLPPTMARPPKGRVGTQPARPVPREYTIARLNLQGRERGPGMQLLLFICSYHSLVLQSQR